VEGGTAERKAMIDPEHDLPIKQQAEILGISRSTVYYHPRPISDDLAGGPLLLRHVTPLTRRHVVYFCSGAYRL
jgi:hypothetical protein